MESKKETMLALLRYILPRELADYFELRDIQVDELGGELHIYLDELITPPAYLRDLDLSPNGFYPEALIRDFPLRDRKVLLHVRRRRWVDPSGKSYSSTWDLTAEGTRYSKEFASFLKELLGYDPNSSAHP